MLGWRLADLLRTSRFIWPLSSGNVSRYSRKLRRSWIPEDSVPLASQIQVSFINMRSIYEIRERPSRMYSWLALLTSQILVEIPWNIFGATLFFVSWYWASGFQNDRAGYTYLMFGLIFPIYYTTIGQSIAAMSPSAEIAAILFNVLFSFVITL